MQPIKKLEWLKGSIGHQAKVFTGNLFNMKILLTSNSFLRSYIVFIWRCEKPLAPAFYMQSPAPVPFFCAILFPRPSMTRCELISNSNVYYRTNASVMAR